MKENGLRFGLAPLEIRADREVLLVALQSAWRALEYADAKLQADRSVVLAAVRVSGLALQYSAPELQGEREVGRCCAGERVRPPVCGAKVPGRPCVRHRGRAE